MNKGSGTEQGFNRLLASTLRPGSTVDEVRAAWGSRWQSPSPKDEGYLGLHDKLGCHVRLDIHGRVGEVAFGPNFPSKYSIEGLRIGMSRDEMLTAHPALGAPIPPDLDLARIGRTDFFETLADGCHLRTAVIKDKVAAIAIERPDSPYPSAKSSPSARRDYPVPQEVRGAPFADPNLKLCVIATLVREGILDLGDPLELAGHVRGEALELDDIDYCFLEDVYEYLVRYPLTQEQLESVEELWLDRGSDLIENYVWPNFDGESDELDVKSLQGIENCTNVRDFSIATQMPVDFAPLRGLGKLDVVWICENAQAVNTRALLDVPGLRKLRCSGTSDLTRADLAALKLRGVDVSER